MSASSRLLMPSLPPCDGPFSVRPTPPVASRATAWAPRRIRWLVIECSIPARVEGRPPALLVVPRELEIIALARHADRDPPDAGPGVQPKSQSPEGAVIRRPRKPGDAECCPQELAALVEHALFDHLVRPH
jgi:hypothetical protein